MRNFTCRPILHQMACYYGDRTQTDEIRWRIIVGNVARMTEMKNEYGIFVKSLKGRDHFKRLKHRLQDNIKIYIKDLRLGICGLDSCSRWLQGNDTLVVCKTGCPLTSKRLSVFKKYSSLWSCYTGKIKCMCSLT